jgi:uncharacterized protein (TIGR03435 family)
VKVTGCALRFSGKAAATRRLHAAQAMPKGADGWPNNPGTMGSRYREFDRLAGEILMVRSSSIAWIVKPWLVVAVSQVYSQPKPSTEFEVASVRPNMADDRIVTINVGPGGRFTARGYTLVLLLQRAYGVMDWNVTGGPAWIRSDRFDVSAKANVSGNLTEHELQPMLRRLLAERFRLKVHHASEQTRGYALVVARDGPKIKAAADPLPSGEERQDEFRMNFNGLNGPAISMPTLARFVAGKLGVVAVDDTGLKGLYDVKAEWKFDPEQSTSRRPEEDLREAWRFIVFNALQNQLGLKLVAKKITIQTIVVDHAEKAVASEN